MSSTKIDQRGAQAGGNIVAGDLINNYPSPALADPRIQEEVETLRKCRWFLEYDRIEQARILARRLQEGVLATGSDELRGRALAWCARILAGSDFLEEAEALNTEARQLTDSNETKIADAVIVSKNGNKSAALSLLAKINEPAALSASLLTVALHEHAEGAISWVNKAGMKPSDFDAEGMSVLIDQHLEIGGWVEAAETARAVDSDLNFLQCPALRMSVALAYLLSAVPEEMRHIVRHQIPFQARNFGLASDDAGMEFRALALERFNAAVTHFADLKLPRASETAKEYALWLALENPATNHKSLVTLRSFLRGSGTTLRWVPFAAQYGEKLDVAAVEREIERQTALNGGPTPEGAMARLSLALMEGTRAAVANYLTAHRDELLTHLDPKALAFIEIEMLAKSGQRDQAVDRLANAHSLGLSAEEAARLQHIVDEAKATDLVTARRMRFEASGALADLIPLVDLLADEQAWHDLVKYSFQLFERNKALTAAKQYVQASIKIGRDAQALSFVDEHPGLITQSKEINLMKAWAQYREGLLIESKKTLTECMADQDSYNYRSLRQNIAIAIGDWSEISAIVYADYQDREKREARELIQAAYLALQVGASVSRDLLYTAAEKGFDDAALLASAYFLAARAGWEDDPKVASWLEKAADLSGDDGPIFRTSLKEILEKKPDWDRRSSRALQLLREGVAPLFGVADMLNKSLIEALSLPYLANLSESDPRKRTPIPGFSGKRSVQNCEISGVVGLEATSLLTLGALGLLDAFAGSVESIRIPHSTLRWLFEEKQRAAFHQLSRFRSAQRFQDLLARGEIVEFTGTIAANSELRAQVGDELAALIAQAEASAETGRQHLVVSPASVPRIGSLLEEKAELGEYAHSLVSCQAVVRKLRADGHISGMEEKAALAYLQLNEKEWENPVKIECGAVLYLDDISVSNFQAVAVLDKLKPAGFIPIVTPFRVREANALLSYQRLSDQVAELIENIRAFLHNGIIARKILVGRIRISDDDGDTDSALIDHPTLGAVAFASECNAIIVDDRAINQHLSAGEGQGRRCVVLTTLDVLAALAASDRIAPEELTEFRSRLRRGGYLFVDVCEEEVFAELTRSAVEEGRVVETAELKSIRESILLIRMSAYLQAPAEAQWLNLMLKSLISTLKRLWAENESLEVLRARADWVLALIDIKGWLYCFEPNHALQLLNEGRATHFALLARPPMDAGEEAIAHYLEWANDCIFSPLEEECPEFFARFVQMHKSNFEQLWEISENDDVPENE